MNWNARQVTIAVVLLLCAAPWLGLYPVLGMKILCFALFACAFNLLLGYGGLLSFGHAAFFGSAGYAAGYAWKIWGFGAELGLLFGVVIALVLGAVVGVIAIRRQGIYFAMITLALAQMVYFFFTQASFTGNEDGLQRIPRASLFGVIDLHDDLTLYYVVLVIVLAGFALSVRIVESPFGRILHGIKANAPRATSLGYDIDRFKLIAFVLSAGLAGLAGATKALVLGFATLADVHWSTSGAVVLMTLVGGLGRLAGPAVGAIIVVLLENKLSAFGTWLAETTHIESLRALGELNQVITGLIFMSCVLWLRRGVLGETLAALQHAMRERTLVEPMAAGAGDAPPPADKLTRSS